VGKHNIRCQYAQDNSIDICAEITADRESPYATLDCDGGGVDNQTECNNGDDPLDPSDDCKLTINPIDDLTLECDAENGTFDFSWIGGTSPYNVSVTCNTQEFTTTENVDELNIEWDSSDCDYGDFREGDIITESFNLSVNTTNGVATVTNVSTNFPATNEVNQTGTNQTYTVTGPLASNFAGISTLANNGDVPGTVTINYIFNGFPQSVTVNITAQICAGGNEVVSTLLNAIVGDCPPVLINDLEASTTGVKELKPCCYDIMVTDAIGCTALIEACIVEPTDCPPTCEGGERELEAFCAYIIANPESEIALADCDRGGINNLTECNSGGNPFDSSDDCQLTITPLDDLTLECGAESGSFDLNWLGSRK